MAYKSGATVYLVDDFAPIRERLAEILTQTQGVRIVGEAGDVASAVPGIIAAKPRFVVLDYKLADGTGLDVLTKLAGVARDSVFIVLTNHVSPSVRAACTAAGARYFLDKSGEIDRLTEIVAGPTTDSPGGSEFEKKGRSL